MNNILLFTENKSCGLTVGTSVMTKYLLAEGIFLTANIYNIWYLRKKITWGGGGSFHSISGISSPLAIFLSWIDFLSSVFTSFGVSCWKKLVADSWNGLIGHSAFVDVKLFAVPWNYKQYHSVSTNFGLKICVKCF